MIIQELAQKHVESMKWLGLEKLLVAGNNNETDERLAFLYNTLNEKLNTIKTFDELELFFKHTGTIAQSRPFIKGTRLIVSQFEAVKSPDGSFSHVKYDYGYGEGQEECLISKLHERIEFK